MINATDFKISNRIKCSICRATIKDRHRMYQSPLKMGVICKVCRERFSENDIEMIVNIFFAFGGYFGQFDKSEFSIQEVIVEFAKQVDSSNSTFDIENLMMWHKVLTHGITPEEFLRDLGEFVDHKM